MTFSTIVFGLICLIVGACVGLLTAALCCMAREGDK